MLHDILMHMYFVNAHCLKYQQYVQISCSVKENTLPHSPKLIGDSVIL